MRKKELFIHPTAIVESNDIGEGTYLWAMAHIMKGAKIGKGCNIGDHVFVESGATVGDYVTVKNGVMIWEGVTIEDGVFVGPGVIFTNDMNPRSSRFKSASGRYAGSWLETTLVMQGCSIGAGSVIVCGTELGRFSMIGAGSVVVKSVPAHALVYGNPARVRGYVCKCGTALNVGQGKGCCPLCNKRYIVDEKGVRLNEE